MTACNTGKSPLPTQRTTVLEILAGLICIIAGIALSWWLSV